MKIEELPIITIEDCNTKTDVLRKLNLPVNGKSLKIVKKYIELHNLDITHFRKYTPKITYERIIKSCPVCTKEFETLKGHNREKTVCSTSCSNTYFRSGENNPNYKKEKIKIETSKVYSILDEDFENLVKNSKSYSECLRILKLVTKGGSSSKVLKRRINSLNISTEHFEQKVKQPTTSYTLDEILIQNSTYSNTHNLKLRLIREKYIDNNCSVCQINSWQNKPISLQLDHINGVNNDNRIENLRILCPNCHSQTDTYAGKNKS